MTTRNANTPNATLTRRGASLGLAASGFAVLLSSARAATSPATAPAASAGTPAKAEPPLTIDVTVRREKLFAQASLPAEIWSASAADATTIVRVKHGEEVWLRLKNSTPAPLSLHWHGVRGPNASDGVGGLTQPPVPPGGSTDYRFTPPDSGTFLIRPIVLGSATAAGSAGVAGGHGVGGLLIVDEKEPPRLDGDHALLVRDWLTQPSGEFAPFGAVMEAAVGGRLGNRLTLAGADAPKSLDLLAGSRVRLRVANGCNARIMRIRFDDMKVAVVAVDGQPTEAFEPLRSSLPFPPGTRYDLVVDAPAGPGDGGTLMAMIGEGLPLLKLRAVARAAGAGLPARAPLDPKLLAPNPRLPPEIKLQNAVRRDVAIGGGATRGPTGDPVFAGNPRAVWTLNGTAGSTASPPLLTAKRGQPVVIGINNTTRFPQPLHLHGHVFRLLHALDDGWEPYWLDTLQIAEGKTAHIAFMAENPGRWLLGSTVLERLDTGLWTWFEVT